MLTSWSITSKFRYAFCVKSVRINKKNGIKILVKLFEKLISLFNLNFKYFLVKSGCIDKKKICINKYEKLNKNSNIVYGKDIKSNYQNQGLKLSKHFK